MKISFTITALFMICAFSNAQTGTLSGTVSSGINLLPYANIAIAKISAGAVTDSVGAYKINDIPIGNYKVVATSIGYRTIEKSISIKENEIAKLDFELQNDTYNLDQIVVTGTRTPKRRTNSPVIVNLITSKTLDQVVATSLSEGLKYQPGLRVETDCQTCNYTQLRMN